MPSYTQVTSKIGFLAMRKLSRFNDRKMAHISNMGHFLIVEARGFGVVRKPIFEVTCVYSFSLAVLLHLSFLLWLPVEAGVINSGQNILKPLTRFDGRVKYQTGVDAFKGHSLILTARMEKVVALPHRWVVSFRADIPYEWLMCPAGFQNQNSNRFGDSLFQFLFVSPDKNHWASAYGMKIIFPTAGPNINIGDGKYQLLPTFALGYDLDFISPGSNIGILLRQAFDIAGYHTAPSINQTYMEPFLNLNFPHDWFVSLSPEIFYNWPTKAWFVPFDITVGKIFQKKIVVSLEYDYALVRQYPQYSQQVECRIGYFF